MKKKIRVADPSPVDDLKLLKLLVQQHSQFFDKLVELIPAKFYLAAEDEKPWVGGLSKVARASAKKETRENIKKARRARLDPEKSSGTLDLLKKNLEKENEEEEEEKDEEENEKPTLQKEKEGSLTYEELRERLHRKMEELRSGRKAGPFEESNRMKKRLMNQEFRGKRKREIEVEGGKKQEVVNAAAKIEKDVSEATEGLAFSHVKIGDEDEAGRKKKKLSKLQALDKAKKLVEAKNDPEKGEIVAEKHAWSAAVSRAQGIKIHDDPKLIKQSIKKEKKKHEKNVGKWKDRIESRDKVRAEKQKKRTDNITGRIQDNKKRKIEKREKKLMRPGFEGRKEETRRTISKVSNAVSPQQMKAIKVPDFQQGECEGAVAVIGGQSKV